ncbi:DNA-binding protein [Paenibacillus sp. GbtcB18]|uniref:DNA-binding protein n=1 Tax=Paenibacillus sp. GbtcB18 TaxID=2824763 RepID=UPI001C309CD9|nr:DNA-binding protein [Paenibacillus sp. GbtcB18]
MNINITSREELISFIASEVVNSTEAVEILGSTRQNLKSFVDRGKLVPIKEYPKDRWFLRSDVLECKKNASRYNRKAANTETDD